MLHWLIFSFEFLKNGEKSEKGCDGEASQHGGRLGGDVCKKGEKYEIIYEFDLNIKVNTEMCARQCVTVLKMLNDTDTFSSTKYIFETETFSPNFSRYRFEDSFPVPNFFDTNSETFFGTNLFRC